MNESRRRHFPGTSFRKEMEFRLPAKSLTSTYTPGAPALQRKFVKAITLSM